MKKKGVHNFKLMRVTVQTLVLGFVFLMGVNNFLDGKFKFFPSVSTHNTCPFGGVETLYTYIATGEFLSKLHSSVLILMGIVFIITLTFGAVFCGLICPFGTIQEWIGKLGKKIFPKKFNGFIPEKLDSVLRYVRYVFLFFILYKTAVVGKLIFETNDPYYAVMNFFNGEVVGLAFVFLGISLILSLFVERPFCKYLCPYGAMIGPISLLAPFKVRRRKSTCIGCKRCDQICPMNIKVSEKETVIGHHCISCYKCLSSETCPVENTVVVGTKSALKEEGK